MSQPFADEQAAFGPSAGEGAIPRSAPEDAQRLPLVAQYLVALLLVAVATVLAFVVDHLIAAPNLTLIFVLPVVIAATTFGWGPALAAAVAGVLAFDFFFTQPYFSFRIASPSDLWAAGLLLVIASIVSTLAGEARRRAVEARRAAEQARALQALAHVVIEGRPQAEIVKAAATALSQIFHAPAVIFMERGGGLGPVASAGGATAAPADEAAARGALSTRLATRAGVYPYDGSKFDFWPVIARDSCRCVVGVDFSRTDERPLAPERFVEVVGGYLAAALAGR
jgi:two-component system sensor histidine kinase KdpD